MRQRLGRCSCVRLLLCLGRFGSLSLLRSSLCLGGIASALGLCRDLLLLLPPYFSLVPLLLALPRSSGLLDGSELRVDACLTLAPACRRRSAWHSLELLSVHALRELDCSGGRLEQNQQKAAESSGRSRGKESQQILPWRPFLLHWQQVLCVADLCTNTPMFEESHEWRSCHASNRKYGQHRAGEMIAETVKCHLLNLIRG